MNPSSMAEAKSNPKQLPLPPPRCHNRFTSESRILFNYYKYICLMASPWHGATRTVFTLLYGSSRLMWISKQAYIILLYFNVFYDTHGALEEFDYYEIFMWLIGYNCMFGSDIMCQNPRFLPGVISSFNLWDDLWDKFASRVSEAEERRLRRSYKAAIRKLCVQFWFLDLWQFLFITLYASESLNSKMNVYSIISAEYKSPLTDALSTITDLIVFSLLLAGFSSICAIPTMLAYSTQHIVNSMAVTINRFPGSVGNILCDCQRVRLSLQWINDSVSSGLLVQHIFAGFQQATELYVTLKMIHYDVPFFNIMFFLLDVFISASRFVHNLHGLSVVSKAWDNLEASIQTWFRLNKNVRNERSIRKYFRSIQKIQMKVGSTRCNKNFFLVALQNYSDAYATGALWP